MGLGAIFSLCVNLMIYPLKLYRRWKTCPKGAWVHLRLDGPVPIVAQPRPFWVREPYHPSLGDIRAVVDALIEDPKPEGLLVELQGELTSAATRTALVRELRRVRGTGKRLVIHLGRGGDSGTLLLSSVADRVLMAPATALGPLGFQVGSWFAREALDSLGVVPEVLAAGDFKTAGEPFTHRTMSEPQKEQLGRLLDVMWDELVDALCRGRNKERKDVERWLNLGLIDAENALSEKIVDAIAHDDEVPFLLNEKRAEKEATLVDAMTYLVARTTKLLPQIRRRPKVAVVEIKGAIVENSPVPSAQVAEEDVVIEALDAVREQPFDALALLIDSPGGGVLASEKIHRAVQRIAEKKPVVAVMGGVAASGGYYIASAAHHIVAQPTTITGSIGVVAFRAAVGPWLEKLGVHRETMVRGEKADLFSLTRPLNEGEKSTLEAHLAQAYDTFLQRVATGRKMTVERVKQIAGGRVWAGTDALNHGLVDALGGTDDAMRFLASKLDVEVGGLDKILVGGAQKPPWAYLLQGALPRMPGASVALRAMAFASQREQVFALWMPGLFGGDL